jgi:hypothetical protein
VKEQYRTQERSRGEGSGERGRKEAREQASKARMRREVEEQVQREAGNRWKQARMRTEIAEQVRREVEEEVRREAEGQARKEAEERGKREFVEQARKEAEGRARSEEHMRREAEEQARWEAEEQAQKVVVSSGYSPNSQWPALQWYSGTVIQWHNFAKSACSSVRWTWTLGLPKDGRLQRMPGHVLGAAATAYEPRTRTTSAPGRQPPVRRRGRGASRPPNPAAQGGAGLAWRPQGPEILDLGGPRPTLRDRPRRWASSPQRAHLLPTRG